MYVIGVLGSVNDVHKGRDIVSTVMRLAADCNAKLRFELIGADVADFSGISGVHATGAYANDAVFDLAKSRRVDVWLFVSVFEESYGLALSIAMRTGLPIVYNDVGAYTERLVYRTNAFPVDGHDAHAVLRTLRATSTRGASPRHTVTRRYQVYDHNPEWLWLLERPQLQNGTRRCRMS